MGEPPRPTPLLGHRVVGPADGAPLVLVHGFTQNAGCWGPVEHDLAVDHRLVLLGAPGHGTSAATHLAWPAAIDALAATGGRGTWIGYSMGGRLALGVALTHPEAVERLVLVGASAGIADPVERAARRGDDAALARHLLAVGVDAFLDEWLAQPLFGGLTVDQAQRSARRANTADGLAAALRDLGTGAQPDLRPALDRLRRRRLPVLVVVGADDAKFTAIGHELVQAIGPTASLSSIAGAGHTAHLERPEPFLEALRQWLGSTAGPTTHDPTTDDPTIQR